VKKEHLFSITKKDFTVQAFRGSGPGGQHRNKTDSAIRIIHSASGAVGESQTDRSQYRNKRLALQRLVASKKFKIWITRIVWEITSGKTIEQRVEESMVNKNLRVDVKDENGIWVKDGEKT